jgi:hypothetical protein
LKLLWALQTAEKLSFYEWHGFSRAVNSSGIRGFSRRFQAAEREE